MLFVSDPINLVRVSHLDLVPDDRSWLLRYMIETLFIVHAETKLNMICPVGQDVERTYGQVYDVLWCRGLDHPRMPSVLKPDMTQLL